MQNNADEPYISRETEKTLNDEEIFMKHLYDIYFITCTKMPPGFILDFFMTGGGLTEGKAVAEFKQRKMDSINQYDDKGGIFVNEKKITRMKLLKRLYNISGYIFIGLTGGGYYKCKVDDINFKHMKVSVNDNLYGGFNRGGEKDRQLTFTIPSHNFSNL